MKKPIPIALAATALASAPLSAQLIGVENFTYPDGQIANLNGGTGFNYDNFHKAVTAFPSDWDTAFGTAPAISGNTLVTNAGGAKREYNGPTEGTGGVDGADDLERSGAVRGAGRVFYRFTCTRTAGITWSGASSYDFGSERVFFGVPGGNGTTGGLEFGCQVSGGAIYRSGIPADTATHTFVTVLDFDHDFIGIWIDPDSADYYDPADGSNTTNAGGSYTGTNWSTAVRLASSGATTWDDLSVAFDPASVGLKAYTDADNDGLPASWENLYGLDDSDDGTVGETSPGAKDGPNGALGNGDDDGVTNLVEYQDQTFPNDPDTDFDQLTDGQEKTLGTNPRNADTDGDLFQDGEELASVPPTDPKNADTDNGGTYDSTEVALGTNPTISGDDLLTNGNPDIVGIDFFDTYSDGVLVGLGDGVGWDYDNRANGDAFTGHSTNVSTWANITAAPSVQGGVLFTQDSSIKRAFHGGPDTVTNTVGETSGAWRYDADGAGGLNGSDVLYAKVTVYRQPGASWSGMSLYDFGTERIFVGVPSAANPASGVLEFGIQQSAGAVPTFSGMAPSPGTTYTLVAKYDFAASRVDLWVDPDLNASEGSIPPSATLTIATTEMNGTGIRFGSGGTGAAGWDRLVIGTTWDSLDSLPSDTDGDGMPDDYEDLFGLNKQVNDANGHADGDNFTNLQEYIAGTNPTLDDTDGDGLNDGPEEAAAGTSSLNPDTDSDGLNDGDEVSVHFTLPLDPDTDNDGQLDGVEVAGNPAGTTSDPLDPSDTVGAPFGIIGREDFAYTDGPVGGLAGGEYFDYENWLFNGPFYGHTGLTSDWDGTGAIAGGKLVTQADTFAYRDFNGPTEGAGSNEAPTGARAGAINQEASHDVSVVYFKTEMTRRSGATLSVFGPDDFGAERVAFGIVDVGGVPQWGIREGAVATSDLGALAVNNDQTYTVVGKLDFDGDLLSLWVNPNLADIEANNAPHVTHVYAGTNWTSGIRLASTGTGNTEWDNVAVASTWAQLSGAAPLDIGLRITGFNPTTGILSLSTGSLPEGTFHLRSSPTLQAFMPLVPPFDFTSATPQPFQIQVDPETMPKMFFRIEEGPSEGP